MSKIENQLSKLESKISSESILNPAISKSPVGWHIEHTLLTINRIIEALQHSVPNNYKWRFNLIKLIVFATKKIPRGSAKSPEVVVPKEYNAESLTLHVQRTKDRITELGKLSKDKYFHHPFFGDLRLKQAITFLEIHTNHHLKIINDILQN